MKKFFLLVLIISVSGVYAADEGSGAYVGAGIGVVKTKEFDSTNMGFNINAGYAFNKYFALEGDLAYLGGAKSTDYSSGTPITATGKTSFLTVAARGTLPLNDLISLYGKLGAGLNFASFDLSMDEFGASTSKSSTNFAGLIGAGVAFNLSKNWALKLEDNYYITTDSLNIYDIVIKNSSFGYGNSNYLNLAAEYRF